MDDSRQSLPVCTLQSGQVIDMGRNSPRKRQFLSSFQHNSLILWWIIEIIKSRTSRNTRTKDPHHCWFWLLRFWEAVRATWIVWRVAAERGPICYWIWLRFVPGYIDMKIFASGMNTPAFFSPLPGPCVALTIVVFFIYIINSLSPIYTPELPFPLPSRHQNHEILCVSLSLLSGTPTLKTLVLCDTLWFKSGKYTNSQTAIKVISLP